MSGGVLSQVIRQCMELDGKAFKTYSEIAGKENDRELNNFWNRMASEESRHLSYWTHLEKVAKDGGLPQLFDNPTEVLNELKEVNRKVDSLLAGGICENSSKNGFIIGFYLEFHLLHPAFETLFSYIRTLPEIKLHEEYEQHLERFLEAMRSYSQVTPEQELLSDCIRRLYKENKQLVRQNHIDTLTGALNRKGIFQAVRTAFYMAERGRQSVALMMIDIDNFKSINDDIGHQAGDDSLRKVVKCIREHIRASDLIGRYGGDEFMVCMTPVDPGFVAAIAEKLRTAVEKKTGGKTTVSIGVAYGNLGRDIDNQLEEVIRLADIALLQAKSSGKNASSVLML